MRCSPWGDLQQSWFQKYHLPAVIVNPLDPAMLSVQTANFWAWDLDRVSDQIKEQATAQKEREENHFR